MKGACAARICDDEIAGEDAAERGVAKGVVVCGDGGMAGEREAGWCGCGWACGWEGAGRA